MATAAEILKVYAGKRTNLPQTLTMEHVSGATRLMEKRRQMFEVRVIKSYEQSGTLRPTRQVLIR